MRYQLRASAKPVNHQLVYLAIATASDMSVASKAKGNIQKAATQLANVAPVQPCQSNTASGAMARRTVGTPRPTPWQPSLTQTGVETPTACAKTCDFRSRIAPWATTGTAAHLRAHQRHQLNVSPPVVPLLCFQSAGRGQGLSPLPGFIQNRAIAPVHPADGWRRCAQSRPARLAPPPRRANAARPWHPEGWPEPPRVHHRGSARTAAAYSRNRAGLSCIRSNEIDTSCTDPVGPASTGASASPRCICWYRCPAPDTPRGSGCR